MGLNWQHTIWNQDFKCPTDKLLFIFLADNCSDNKNEHEFYIEDVADYVGISRRHVARLLAEYSEMVKYVAGKGRSFKSKIVWLIQQRKRVVKVDNKVDIKGDNKVDNKVDTLYKGTTLTTLTTEEQANASTDVVEVFEYWQHRLNKQQSSLTTDRRAKIQARLKNFSASQLKTAIDGVLRDDWLMGRTSQSTKTYTDLSTIFKNDSKVESLIELGNTFTPTPKPKPKDDSGLYKNAEQLRAEYEYARNNFNPIFPKRESVNVR